MRNQEEVEFSINDFALLYEPIVDIGALGWVLNACVRAHLEESLPYSLVYDN